MTDRFFTDRGALDRQLERHGFSAGFCQFLIEGAVRRLAQLEGPTATAVRLQRLADICAVADMKPLSHWWKPQRRLVRILKAFRRFFWSTMAGFGLAMLIGDILRLWQP